MNVRINIMLLSLLIAGSCIQAQETIDGHKIALSISGIQDTSLLLAHRYGDKFYTDDTIRLNHEGFGEFAGSSALPRGMYQVVFPDKTFFDFFIDEVQHFTIETTYPDFAPNNRAIGSKNNQLFFDWFRANIKYRQSPEMTHVWDTTLQVAGNSLVGQFIRALKPFEVPDSLKKDKNFANDQAAQYHYYKEHFFDQVDLTNADLLRTPVIHNKLNQFFSNVVPPQPDSINRYCDLILDQAKPSPEVFRYALQFLLNYYSEPKIMGTDAVYVYLAEKYYLSGIADWIDDSNLLMIRNRVNEVKDLLIGKPAPVVKGLQTLQGEVVNPFESKHKYSILYFWEPDCGHCKKATPELFSLYPWLKSLDIEVYAINTRLDLDSWENFIAEHELTWINLYSPENVRQILEVYNAWSTPLIFILDAQKRIIAKDLAVSQVKEFVSYLTKQKGPDGQ